MDADRVKQLDLIQGVVNRLASNSFSVKGWSITLVAALFALAAKDANPLYSAIAVLPAAFFWGLDAYYLRQERLFRGLYRLVVAQEIAEPGRTVPDVPLYSMSTRIVQKTDWVAVDDWFKVVRSPTMLGFHGPVILSAFAVLAYGSLRPPPKIEPDKVAASVEQLVTAVNKLTDKVAVATPPSAPPDAPVAHKPEAPSLPRGAR
jgi:hypothetical protein